MENNILTRIQKLPYEIQFKIYLIVISEYNKYNFFNHNILFKNCLNTFKNNNEYLNIKDNGFWIRSQNYNLRYTPVNLLCLKYFKEDQNQLMSVFFSEQEKQFYKLPFDREYYNCPNEFWFYYKCRCFTCDQIKMSCILCNKVFLKNVNIYDKMKNKRITFIHEIDNKTTTKYINNIYN